MNRGDFQRLAEERQRDAAILLKERRFAAAYYLAGYAVECGLKACVAKKTKEFDFPPKPRAVQDMYVHDLAKLVRSADLGTILDEELKRDKDFETNWACAKDWSEDSRYRNYTPVEATTLIDAVSDKEHGVLQWIRRHW